MGDELLLLYLTHKYFEQGKAIRGGALVTDDKTRPVEFRCTSPIRPTDYQRVLYGGTLDGYIFVDLIGIPLINKARETVSLVLVEEDEFLDVRPLVDIPVARLARGPKGTTQDQLSLEVHPDFKTEKAFVESSLRDLAALGIDLADPFERIRLVLDQAHEKGIGDEKADAE
jgi:hypothetical protein